MWRESLELGELLALGRPEGIAFAFEAEEQVFGCDVPVDFVGVWNKDADDVGGVEVDLFEEGGIEESLCEGCGVSLEFCGEFGCEIFDGVGCRHDEFDGFLHSSAQFSDEGEG